MHLVFVTSLVPDGAPSTGYEIANAAIIAALRRQGVRVTVIGYVRPGRTPIDPDNTIVLGEIDPANENASPFRKIGWVAAAVINGLTVSSAKLRTMSDSAFETALKSAGECDAYVLNAVQMTAAYESAFAGKPTLFVAHNVEHISAVQNAWATDSRLQSLLFSREAGLLRAIESRLCANARFVFTLAEADRQALGVTGSGRSAVLPLVTADKPVTVSPDRQIAHDAGLIGTWTWQPNRVGLEWFLSEVTPYLPDDFRIAVAGSAPRDLAKRHQHVRFVGRVEDAGEFVRSSAVIPLISRAGTGVQLKTIETFEMGLPAVATSSSLRGISMIPDNCEQADDPRTFASALQKLARNPVLADGRMFHAAQLRGLDEAVSNGLKALGHVEELVPA
ncbi:MAG: glycosyltransferase [Rhizobiaceae bacterium]